MRICFVSPRFPYPTLTGDTTRVLNQLRLLSGSHRVTLVALAHQQPTDEGLARVAEYCERVVVVPLPRMRRLANLGRGLVSPVPMQVAYFRAAAMDRELAALQLSERFDLIHAVMIRTLPYVWNQVGVPVVADLIDSLGLNLHSRARAMCGPKRLAYTLECRRVRRYERAVVGHFPGVIVSSLADKEDLGHDEIAILPNGVDLDQFAFSGIEGRDAATVVFTGNIGYPPNEEAVLWFAREAWPLIRAARPDARWLVVGANPGPRVLALDRPGARISVLGRVPDVAAYLRRATVAASPVRSGSGTQTKVLEAMATGTPVVASPVANRGVQGVHGSDLLVADSGREMAAALLRLLDDPSLRGRLGRAGRECVERNFSWQSHGEGLNLIYDAAARRVGAGPRSGVPERDRRGTLWHR